MNVAQARPRLWSPQVALFAIILHAALLYYVAVAFKVIPAPEPLTYEPPTIQAVRLPPKPPEVVPETRIEKTPRFVPRRPDTPPVVPMVPPLPLPPQPATASTANADVMVLNKQIEEQPVLQALPRYPQIAQERGIEGRVIMSITILPDGSVRDVRIVSSQPQGYFEAAAVRAVQSWRYRPSNVVRTNVIVHMDFELRDG